jgi:hypothetical protein
VTAHHPADLNGTEEPPVSHLASLVVAMTVGAVAGLAAGIFILRRIRAGKEVREGDPWWQWQKQWQRMEVGLRRVAAVHEGRQSDSVDALYELHSFFLNCHHLRDWLAADKRSGMSRKEAAKVIDGSRCLQVCADLANRAKHVEVRWSHCWEIAAGDETYDALDLAADCVAEWERALTDRGLLNAR